jgi:hypothetical protein
MADHITMLAARASVALVRTKNCTHALSHTSVHHAATLPMQPGAGKYGTS